MLELYLNNSNLTTEEAFKAFALGQISYEELQMLFEEVCVSES